MLSNITERKQAEEALRANQIRLRESDEHYRCLVESVEDYSILMLDPRGCIASWTVAAERIKGYSAEEILGKHFSCFYTPEDVERGRPEEVLRTAALEGRLTEEGVRLRKDGSRFWAAVSITAIRDAAGELTGFSKITRDITERVEHAEKVRQNEEMFRALLESAPDAVIIADQQGKISLVNAQAERLFHYDRHEMEGQSVELLIPAHLRPKHEAHRETYRNSARVRQMGTRMELKGIRKTGEEFPVEVSLSPIRTAHGSWVAAAIRDITERKVVEQQLVIERRRAEEANRAKSDFLAAVSHDIRTPMNAILGISEVLSETNLSGEQRQLVDVFRRAGSNLMTLINDILDLSKIEAGRVELEQTEFNLREPIDQTIELITPKTHGTGIRLRACVAAGLSAHLAGDSARLRQVLINLLGNAIKFTQAGEVGLIVQPEPSGLPDRVEFVVTDTGIGIPENQIGTIFEDFKQGDASITRNYGGTGLGLGISGRIVERMGGAISVTSTVGKGSTFRFAVQLRPVTERIVESPVFVPDFHGRRVAIIDSAATNRLIMRETFGAWGFQPREFSTPEDALISLAPTASGEYEYALAVIDRWMPGMDGFELVSQIRALVPELPVIMLTSEDRPGDDVLRRTSNLTGYAVRPVSRAGLLQLVSKAMGELRQDVGPAQEPPVSAAIHPYQRPLKILIAEDSLDNRFLIEIYLKGTPHVLTFVEHGQGALDMFNSSEFDIVLMDLQMPVMDGLTATRRIREIEQRHNLPAVPILALSANARPQDVKLSLEAGCNAHLSKPISKQC